MNSMVRSYWIIPIVLLALILFLCLGCPQPKHVVVPHVIGLSQYSAQSEIAKAGLSVGMVAEQYHGTVPLGMVIAQNPMPGVSITSGAKVNLIISKGLEPVLVPDVVGWSLPRAMDLIATAGLISTVVKEHNDTVPADTVITQSPTAGSMVVPGSIVQVVVSQGPKLVFVPDVIGTSQQDATAVLMSAGLTIGPVSEQYSDAAPVGLVIGQLPLAGAHVMPGIAVSLVVSRGPEPVLIPDVIGVSQTVAESAILDAGLMVGSIFQQHSEDVPAGHVISHDPGPGTTVLPGSAVDLIVSQGPDRRPVPNVTGLWHEEAQAAIMYVGLVVGSVSEEHSEAVVQGHVTGQTPEGGVLVPPGSAVKLVLSKGPQPLPVPDVVNLLLEEAEVVLTNAGFIVGQISAIFSDTIASHHVVSQIPASGTVPPGTAVDLVVSKGPGIIVPDVVGESEANAVAMIEAAGLLAGTVTEAYSDDIPHGLVMAQAPEAGAEVPPVTEVNLLISLGPESGTTMTIMLPGDVPLEMVRIPAGTFLMGRYPDEQDSLPSEGPQHEVTIAYDFWMGKYSMTKRQWLAIMNSAPWSGRVHVLTDLNSPAVYISWNDARSFVAALNDYLVTTGQGPGDIRLPSEAEWEYAARAGTTTRFYWGDDPSHARIYDYAWWKSNAYDVGNLYAHVVGQKLPNEWGLYDMSGNVWEWCEDDWHSNYEGAPGDGRAWRGSPRGPVRVLRGGSWYYYAYTLRSAHRTYNIPSHTNNIVGFRIAR